MVHKCSHLISQALKTRLGLLPSMDRASIKERKPSEPEVVGSNPTRPAFLVLRIRRAVSYMR